MTTSPAVKIPFMPTRSSTGVGSPQCAAAAAATAATTSGGPGGPST